MFIQTEPTPNPNALKFLPGRDVAPTGSREFLSIDHVAAEHPTQVQAILGAYAAGLDFADAVHAYQRPEDESLVTFDKQFVRRAAKAGVRGVRVPG